MRQSKIVALSFSLILLPLLITVSGTAPLSAKDDGQVLILYDSSGQ